MNYVKHQSLVIKTFLLGIAVIFLFACGGGGDSTDTRVLPITPGGYLVEGVSLGEVSVATIKIAAQSAGYPQFSEYMKYSIKLYKITYRTTYKGQPILASGLISYPTGLSDSMPTLVVGNYQTFADRDTPSEFSLPNQRYTAFAFIASAGYLTLIPDMIGFGESKDKVFPMRNYVHSANAMIDFIYASEEFVEAANLRVNGKKFLTGYSEGGYIAMATLKMIEESPDSGISIDATAVGGGGYNLVNILNNQITNATYDFPSDIAMLLYSYNSMYDWKLSLSYFFNELYADRIPVLFNGEYGREEINKQLTTTLVDFLNTAFLNNLRSKSYSESDLKLMTALSDNSVDNWAPKSLLSIIHGKNDEIIPFSDSEETYNKMVANGSKSVTFTPIETEGGHVDSGIEFIEIALLWFNSLNP